MVKKAVKRIISNDTPKKTSNDIGDKINSIKVSMTIVPLEWL